MEARALTFNESTIAFLHSQSLLGLFLEPSEITNLLSIHAPIDMREGELLFSQGDRAEYLYVILEGEALIVAGELHSAKSIVGRWDAGRSANLFSVLREIPYQYTSIAGKNCRLLKFPWNEIKPLMERSPVLMQYLKFSTESEVIRTLAKEMTEAGISSAFRVQVLGNLEGSEISGQTWITQVGQTSAFTFIILDGAVNAYRQTDKGPLENLWEVPKNSWQFWVPTVEGTPIKLAYRALTQVKLFKLERDTLLKLAAEFPEDFGKYQDWLSQGAKANESDASPGEREDVDNLVDLFPPLPKEASIARQYPFVAQYNEMDCGPACLTMISKYFGNEIPIQYWREQVGTSREGTSIFDMAKGAEKIGFSCHGLEMENIRDVEQELLPVIALRRYHFVVVYEITSKHVVIGNPESGIQTMSLAEFAAGYEKVILLLKPTESFYQLDVPTAGNAHFLGLMKGHLREIGLIFACSLVIVLLSLFPPILSQIILDEVLSKKDMSLLWFALGIGVAVVVCKGVMTWIRAFYLNFITSKFDFRSHSAFIRKLFSLPYSFFATRHVGDFTRRLSEMERVRTFLTTTVVSTLIDLTTLVFYAVVLCFYSPSIAIMTFILAPILVLISVLFSKKLVSEYAKSFVSRAEQESLLTDLVKGIGTVKTLGAELAARWRFEERLVKTLKSSYAFSLTASALNTLSDSYTQIAKFAIMGFAAYLGMKGSLTPGQVVALSMLVVYVIEPFHGLANAWSGIQETKAVMERLNDIFLAPSEDALRKTGGLKKRELKGDIEFQDVWFRYGGESSEWILKGVSFKIKAGQQVAIVGPSGSGKSTISYLLARIYEPTKGHIYIDGRDYREYDLTWLRCQIGLLHQESNLFNGSIAENIAFGTPVYSLAQVSEAAKLADADAFITKKLNDYQYVISHGGYGLSGGEKQRVALARTIFAKPSILVLDEATSALDGISEKKLLNAVKESFSGKTTLSIAHRYSTVIMSDFALVIADGRIVGFGTHEQLSEERGVYSELFGTLEKDVV